MEILSRVKKLLELERNILKPVEPGSTKLDYSLFPEPERLLFDTFRNICDYWNYHEDFQPSEPQLHIIEQAHQRLTSRIIDLFTTFLQAYFRIEQLPEKNLMLTLRFWHFMFELGRHMEQMSIEDCLGKKHRRFKDYEKAMAEWHRQQENQTPLWTHESFSWWFNKFVSKPAKARR